MQRFLKLHWNALAIVIVLLAHSLALTYTLLSTQTHTHTLMCMSAQMVPIRNACICTYVCTLCMSLPHPRTLPLTHTLAHIQMHTERGTLRFAHVTFEFGFVVSARSHRLRSPLAGLFARFCFCMPPYSIKTSTSS